MADAPVTDDFCADVEQEAAYQVEHWGTAHDADKGDPFWFWTLGHIVGKAIHDEDQTVEKQRHRLRAGAALLLNWDRHIAARNGLASGPLMRMERPGAGPAEVEVPSTSAGPTSIAGDAVAVTPDPPAPCEHAYHVAPLCGVATGQPCARCGEPYDPAASR